MVFKVEQSANLNTQEDIYFTLGNDKDWNNKYLRIIDAVYHKTCYIIQGGNISVSNTERSTVKILTTNFGIQALSQGYRWVIYHSGVQNWNAYADSIDMGTLEIS